MFYDTSAFKKPLEGTRDDRYHAIVMLLPREGKRLIAKGAKEAPEIQRVLRDGWLVNSRGITPAYLLEELVGEAEPKQNYPPASSPRAGSPPSSQRTRSARG